MAVKRIVADIASANVEEVRDFYIALFDLSIQMDQGWIVTLTSGTSGPVQISIMSEGGSGMTAPDLSIEVDNLDEVHATAVARGAEIIYPMTTEPWGVRRFFVRDPIGKVINVMSHEAD